MSRLIDADALHRKLFEYGCHKSKMHPMDVMKMIDEQPTAYDVEDILAALKIMRNDTNQGCLKVDMKKCNQYSDCGLCIMDRAIDIVRKGGVE